MPENKTAYVYNKGDYKYVVANGKRVRKGEEIELTDAQLVDLSHQGFIFSPVDKRRNYLMGQKVSMMRNRTSIKKARMPPRNSAESSQDRF